MVRNFLSGAVILSLVSFAVRADPAADVKAAVKKLADAPNYSWKSTVEGGFGAGATEGKTEKDGYTDVTLTIRDAAVEVVMKGDKGAVKLADGWKTLAEASTAGEAGQPNPGRFAARMVQNFKAPAAQAENMADKSKDLAKGEEAYSGTLTEEGAKELMSFGRRGGANANATPPAITNPKGTVKFWVKDGTLSKMEFNVQGSVSFNGQDRDINRTTTIEIKDVGTTKIDVPAEAKTKMDAPKTT